MIILNILFSIVSLIILWCCIKNLLCKTSVKVNEQKVLTTDLEQRKKKPSVSTRKEALVISYEPFTRYTTIICLSLFVLVQTLTLITFLKHVVVHSTLPYNPFEITYTIA
eukprot:262989_1